MICSRHLEPLSGKFLEIRAELQNGFSRLTDRNYVVVVAAEIYIRTFSNVLGTGSFLNLFWMISKFKAELLVRSDLLSSLFPIPIHNTERTRRCTCNRTSKLDKLSVKDCTYIHLATNFFLRSQARPQPIGPVLSAVACNTFDKQECENAIGLAKTVLHHHGSVAWS